jgi:galactose mutarotase-like enzyme
MANPITLRTADAIAVIHPDLGAWLVRYARKLPNRGWVEVLRDDEAIVARWPKNMWAGNPVLFPHVSFNVARGAEHQYELDGVIYQSLQHGFARRTPWQVVAQSETSVTLEICDSELTRPSYPFAFRFLLTYRLNGGTIEWEQRIENRDSKPLPFSTGFHPYFSVPLLPGSNRNDCFVRLPRATRYNPIGQWESYFTEPFPAQALSVGTDVSGTVFLGDLAETTISLVDPKAGVEASISYPNAPHYRFLALWSRSVEDPFYCIEPWTALPNSFSRSDGEVIILPPGETYHAELSMDAREI